MPCGLPPCGVDMTWMVILAAISVLINVQTRISVFLLHLGLLLADTERARQHPHITTRAGMKFGYHMLRQETVEVVFEPIFPVLLECIRVVHCLLPS